MNNCIHDLIKALNKGEFLAKHHELSYDDDMPDTFEDLLKHLEKLKTIISEVEQL